MELEGDFKMRSKIVCNKCNKKYPLEVFFGLNHKKIVNVKTGISLKKEQVPGTYRIMDIITLPCSCRDSHWVFVTNENKEDSK